MSAAINWRRVGAPQVWLTAAAVALSLLMVAGVLIVVIVNGMAFFWPRDVARIELGDGEVIIGEIVARERIPDASTGGPASGGPRYRIQLKVGNRDVYGLDYRWVPEADIVSLTYPENITVFERQAWGNLYGIVQEVTGDGYVVQLADGRTRFVRAEDVVDSWRPNAMSTVQKLLAYVVNVWEFLTGEPRESNTEGGIFPALFGTVLMVLLMSLAAVPLGALAALFLREYAGEGPLVSAVRVAVNNLAGVPSIVYGVFGLGFFVYGVGGTIDQLFFAERLPTPTFGTGGLLWASLTMALLTVPVVIVATEEGLAAIPASQREASLALGATRWETVRYVILPRAMPGVITGAILAVARAAGEVAPLMLTGVVKVAPALPIDGNPPFVHLYRKFMHLGFHIYDAGFQSPNVEAARPMVFATTLVLLALITGLNLSAVVLRHRLRQRYQSSAF
ncbi:MAG: phosphate ABC transporter permease PstA [Bacillota bacterium]